MKIHPWLSAVCLSSSLVSATAQQTLVQVHGIPLGNLGTSMLHVGDMNGDGFDDLLVGETQNNGSGPGWIVCYSGKYLAGGNQPDQLWAISPPLTGASGAARFGQSMCQVGNLTGNVFGDFIIGAPDYIPPGTTTTTGALFLIDGSTHAIISVIEGDASTHLGQALVAVGDQDGDGKIDVAASAPQVVATNNQSFVHVIPGSAFTAGTHSLSSIAHWSHNVGWHDYGTALASGFDLDGDGKFDLAISTPSYGFSNPGAGFVEVRRATSALTLLGGFTMSSTGEHLGASLDCRRDYNGDGVPDLVCGAPNWTTGIFGAEIGRVVVVSGAALMNLNLPLVIYTLYGVGGGPAPATAHFGAAVSASDDLNNDGVGDIIVGEPEYRPQFPITSPVKGAISIFSGATGMRIGGFVGGSTDHFGDAIAGLGDLDGDGFLDFAVAASTADSPYTDCGIVRSLRLFPTFPSLYCTGKLNSLGCTPAMSSNGSASASSGSPFLVTCANLINLKSGIFFYSHLPLAAPFQGGFLCVKGPVIRVPMANSGGSASGADCTGTYSFDFNARIQSGLDPSLSIGSEVFCQFQSRDQQSPSGTSLSNAEHFVINP